MGQAGRVGCFQQVRGIWLAIFRLVRDIEDAVPYRQPKKLGSNSYLLIANLALLFCGTQKSARLLGSRALRLLQGVNVLVQGLFPGAGLGQVVQAEH